MTLYYPPTTNALQKTLDAQLDSGTTSAATLSNTTGIQNKAGIMLINRVDSNGTLQSTSDWEWVIFGGTSGSTVTTLTRGAAGSSDQDHAVGEIVEFVADTVWADGVMDALDNAFTSAGALDTTKVADLTTAQTFTNKTLTAPVLGGSVTGTYTLAGTPTLTSPAVNTATVTGAITKPAVTAITTGASPNIDLDLGNQFTFTLSEAATFTVSNEDAGQCFLLQITQDSGANEYAVTWMSTVHWVSGTAPTLSTGASEVDLFGFRVTGTDTYQGYVIGQALAAVA